MRTNRSQYAPFIRLDQPWQAFRWTATLTIAPSGYVTDVFVEAAYSPQEGERTFGRCVAYVSPEDDVRLTIEALAVQSAADATEPSLPGFERALARRVDREEIHGPTASRPGGRR
jgi:hypothetical protein